MSDLPAGYRDIPPEDRKKAAAFFEKGAAVAGTGNYDYSIEMFLQGLSLDPEAVEAHQALRDISLKRKASGGKALGMLSSMGLKKALKDDKQSMLNAEKLLAYDPGETNHMTTLLQSAFRAGFWDTVMWIGPILRKAESDLPERKQDIKKFLLLKDVYSQLKQFKLAVDACQCAAMLRPDDMDLQTELKHLGAQHTMHEGKYDQARSFRDSVRDMDGQRELLDQDKDVRTDEIMARQIAQAEQEWQNDPEEPGKIMKLVDALVRTEDPAQEARAIDLLQSAYDRTRQFRFRQNLGRIKLAQLARQDRAIRVRLSKNPKDEAILAEYRQFRRDRAEEELREFQLWAESYPTDLTIKFEIARRHFQLERYGEAIPVFQQARQDPKFRTDAGIFLGRAFLEAAFTDEAVDTLRALIEDYQIKGDDKSKDMYYWYARALQEQGDTPAALKAYSQVAQWDFNYLDVQARIKALRSGGKPPNAPTPEV